MKEFFKSVRRRIGKLDAARLREQYGLVSDEAAFLDTLFKTVSIGIIAIDPDGTAAMSNPAAKSLLGMEPGEAVASLGIPSGRASKREIEISYPERRIVEIQTVPTGEWTIAYLRDATAERERTEEELRAGATKAVRDLAAGVAHEIGNPLNALSLNLQLLERQHPGDGSIAECRRQVSRLDGILKGFLSALRPSRPNLAPGSLAAPLKGCLSTLKNLFEERRITVSLDFPRALPAVAIDAAQMEQVFFNILKNAMEAIKEGGGIAISLFSDDNCVIARFADTGEGMSPEQVAHLFEPYRTSKRGGTGLGLMVSARIVRDHGGSIDVESKEGEGTVFTVRIPRIERRIREIGAQDGQG